MLLFGVAAEVVERQHGHRGAVAWHRWFGQQCRSPAGPDRAEIAGKVVQTDPPHAESGLGTDPLDQCGDAGEVMLRGQGRPVRPASDHRLVNAERLSASRTAEVQRFEHQTELGREFAKAGRPVGHRCLTKR